MSYSIEIKHNGGILLSLGGPQLTTFVPNTPNRRRALRSILDDIEKILAVADAAGALEDDINEESRTVITDGKTRRLTKTEFNIVAFLAKHPGYWRTRTQIMDAIGMHSENEDRSIDSHIQRIRKKGVTRILTQTGIGYCWKT